MILLIFATLSLTLISLWLVNELVVISKALQEEKEMSEMRRKWADTYWTAYSETYGRNRELRKELDIYYEANKDLQNQLADTLHEAETWNRTSKELRSLYEGKRILADSLDERVKELSEEIEKLEGRNKWLQYELENEFEWSMRYSESVDKYARLYDEALKESVRLEGELEQTQETLNMLEYGYELLQHKSEQWKKDLKYYREKYEGNYDPIE